MPIEIVFSFDTTGSMYPCLTQVRRNIKDTVARLATELPDIRIGIIAHGDYCDKNSTYVTKHLPLTSDVNSICKFAEKVGPTGGGDAPECYELVLHEARSQPWTEGTTRALVLIGDDVPHTVAHNPGKLDWRKEAQELTKEGVAIYAVQALNRKHATNFYQELARISGGFHVPLDQFSYVTDMVLAVCYRQTGEEQVQLYEQEVKTKGRMDRGLNRIFDAVMRRTPSATSVAPADLRAVPPGRFQVLRVDHDIAIKQFVLENGLEFKTGRGFYEFTKTETIQGSKEIILQERTTGDFFAGDKAREVLGLPLGETTRIRPTDLDRYAVFVQSTSVNRVLKAGTGFLYEVADWDREEALEDAAPAPTAAPPAVSAPVVSAPPAPTPAAPVASPKPAPVAIPAPTVSATAGARRRFEFVEGTSSKFWEVWVDGNNVCTQYGRIGGAAQSTTKPFADAASARAGADKLIREKTGKGYVEKP
jgi:predicted DNA-binding WGR domain protein